MFPFRFIYRVYAPIFKYYCSQFLIDYVTSYSHFLTGFTTVHVDCTLIRERPFSFCESELGDLRGNIGVFHSSLIFFGVT